MIPLEITLPKKHEISNLFKLYESIVGFQGVPEEIWIPPPPHQFWIPSILPSYPHFLTQVFSFLQPLPPPPKSEYPILNTTYFIKWSNPYNIHNSPKPKLLGSWHTYLLRTRSRKFCTMYIITPPPPSPTPPNPSSCHTYLLQTSSRNSSPSMM